MSSGATTALPADRRRHEGERAQAWIFVAHSPDAEAVGRFVPFSDELLIGRADDAPRPNALLLADASISRRHASVARGPKGFSILDAKSRNGTFVDGKPALGSTPLRENTVVRVGDSVLIVGEGVPRDAEDDAFVGRSPALGAVLDSIDRAASSDFSVLLLGETGTGKELLAERLHAKSGRRGALVALNCAAVPASLLESQLFGHKRGAFTDATQDARGYFASAHGGTLFLDEIGEMPLHLQPRLLRVLETREFTPLGSVSAQKTDARVLAATNVDLESEIRAGTFRADLYARLAGVVVVVPPLRERRSDILLLARHFLTRIAPERAFALSAGAAEALLLHAWPMNVRELKNVCQTLTLGEDPEVHREDLPPSVLARTEREGNTRAPPKSELEALLLEHAGNVKEVARHYGKHPKQIYRWLKHYVLSADAFRAVKE